MTQPSLLQFESLPSVSLVERLAQYFRQRPDTWLDGMDLAKVAGSYAWRSRASDLRKPPYSMTVENRVRRLPGSKVRVSEYKFVAKPEGQA